MEKRLPLPVGTVLKGRYRVIRQLGHGGMGAVYEAVDDEINLSFAVKETFYADNEELNQAFKREARILASLSHDAFPRVSHYFSENDGCFLVMEMIRGDDLDKLLKKRIDPFEQEQVLAWADQILDALEDLHHAGIIHRDIKPSNLKLTPKGKIKLLDFGISKGTLEGETTVFKTIGSIAAATLEYAPLEQVLKASPHYQAMLTVNYADKVSDVIKHGTDATSDLYSLAATLYHLLTGHLPVDAPTRAFAVWSGQFDRLIAPHEFKANVSKEVSEVLLKAMSLERRERYQSATQMHQALNEAAKSAAKKIIPPTEPAPTGEPEITTFISERDSSKNPRVTSFRALVDKLKKQSLRKRSRFSLILTTIALPLLLIMLVLGLILQSRDSNTENKNANQANLNTNSNSNANAQPTIPTENSTYTVDKTIPESGAVNLVAISPDGQTIACVTADNTINLWSADGSHIRKFEKEHTGSINSIEFSPDGKRLASGGADGTAKLWDIGKDKSISTFIDPDSDKSNSGVMSVAFSPESGELPSGNYKGELASGNYSGKICVWNLSDGSRRTLSGHKKAVKSIAFSSDGRMASGSSDNSIILWKNKDIYIDEPFTGFTASVYMVIFSPDGKKIVGIGADNTVRMWNIEDKSFIKGFKLENSQYWIKFSASGKNLIFALKKDRGKGLPTGALPTVTPTPPPTPIPSPMPTSTVSPSSQKLPRSTPSVSVSASPTPTPEYNYLIVFFNVESGRIEQILNEHRGNVKSIAISRDGKTMISGSEDKTIKIWRAK